MKSTLLAFAFLACLLGVILLPCPGTCQCEQQIFADDGQIFDSFGQELSVSGDFMVVGCPLDDDHGDASGSLYIHKRDPATGTWFPVQKILATDGDPIDFFGISVASHNDVIVAGSVNDDDFGFNAGAAYVYRFDGSRWVEEQKLFSHDPVPSDEFGTNVCVREDLIVVSSRLGDHFPRNQIDAGTAYVFRYDGNAWHEEQKLLGGSAPSGSEFGSALAISDDRSKIFIGARFDNGASSGSGNLRIFQRNGNAWELRQLLAPPDGAPLDEFGFSASASGDFLLVGARQNDSQAPDGGAVYAYRFDGISYTEEQRLTRSNPMKESDFGISLEVLGNIAVIGARNDDDACSDPAQTRCDSGAVLLYEYTGNTWAEKKKILPTLPETREKFGTDVSFDGKTLVVGAPGNRTIAHTAGAVYTFSANGLARGNVNAGQQSIEDVLLLNGKTGATTNRMVEYNPLGSFELRMRRPSSVPSSAFAPFAAYLWLEQPTLQTPVELPFGMGCMSLPIPLGGNSKSPQPSVIWNNARRFQKLGFPTRSSRPAPSTFFERTDGLPVIARFFIQGLIYDPGSAAEIPASVTNGIHGIPVFQ